MRPNICYTVGISFLCIHPRSLHAIRVEDPKSVDYYVQIQQSNPEDPRLFYTNRGEGTSSSADLLAITLSECEAHSGPGIKPYTTLGIQTCLATWIVPLFLLIASMPFAPLGIWNMLCVIVHLLADPISSFESQFCKLAYLQRCMEQCRCYLGEMPEDLRKAVAMITISFEEVTRSESLKARHCLDFAEFPKIQGSESLAGIHFQKDPDHDMRTIIGIILGRASDPLNQKQRLQRKACLEAANTLSDCRNSAFPKTLFGVVTYFVALAVSFIHIKAGVSNDDPSHGLTMAILYSWLVPMVLLGALLGGPTNKRSTGDILMRLFRDLTDIEGEHFGDVIVDERQIGDPDSEYVPAIYRSMEEERLGSCLLRQSRPSIIAQSLIRELQTLQFEQTDYIWLSWSGGNTTFRPRQSGWGRRVLWANGVAHLPVICSVLSALALSYTAPTKGIGCRSILQIVFGGTWVINSYITEVIRNRVLHARKQWLYVCLKDTIICLVQATAFFAVFFGWFNSCFCRSAWISLRSRAHITLKPSSSSEIQRLATVSWPLYITAGTIMPLLMLGYVWHNFRKGVNVFHLSDRERHVASDASNEST